MVVGTQCCQERLVAQSALTIGMAPVPKVTILPMTGLSDPERATTLSTTLVAMEEDEVAVSEEMIGEAVEEVVETIGEDEEEEEDEDLHENHNQRSNQKTKRSTISSSPCEGF